MASKTVEYKNCPQCGAQLKVITICGIDPLRSTETGECPRCGTEIIRKNITREIDIELINE